MISVIIPTLRKIDRLQQTLLELSECDEVGEIIVIDNSDETQKFNIRKVVHVFENRNTFINPAWNKGAKISKYDKLCFINDDIWFDWNHLSEISKYITKDNGMLGMSNDNYSNPIENLRINPIHSNQKTTRGHRPIGYACCFFIHKDNWDIIPEELKLWGGDDWLFYRSKNINYLIEGIKCDGQISATLDNDSFKTEFDSIKRNDMFFLRNFVEKGLIENFLLGTIWW